MIIKGTVSELITLIPWEELCEIIHVDYYNYSLVSQDVVFTIKKDENGWQTLGSTY